MHSNVLLPIVLSSIAAVLVIAGSDADTAVAPHDIESFPAGHTVPPSFDDFLKKFNLTFSGKELAHRREVFAENVKHISELKAKGSKGIGINAFAAYTVDELKKRLISPEVLAKDPAAAAISSAAAGPTRSQRQAIPDNYDYRYVGQPAGSPGRGWVSPVKDQGNCGSCWAFSAVALLETVHRRKFGYCWDDLSEQILLDCAYNYGCNGGGWVSVGLDYIRNSGMTYEHVYPYTQVQGACQYPAKWKANLLYTTLSESAIASFIFNTGPVAFGFNVPFEFFHYTGGVFDVPNCSTTYGGHAVVIVGYTPSYWVVKNSWGTGWGDAGYVYYARGKGLCGMRSIYGAYIP